MKLCCLAKQGCGRTLAVHQRLEAENTHEVAQWCMLKDQILCLWILLD